MSILVEIEVDSDVIAYTIDRDTRSITSDDPDSTNDTIPDLVTELLDTGELIGPQVDDFSGAVGTWDDPMNVVAAFWDVAESVEGQVYRFDISGDPDASDDVVMNSANIPA